jgi:cell division protein FtsZ
MIHFDLPKEKSSIIKVIGVGGGGSNAVNHMFNQHIEGVNFIICNTDAQAIAQSNVPNKVQQGPIRILEDRPRRKALRKLNRYWR